MAMPLKTVPLKNVKFAEDWNVAKFNCPSYQKKLSKIVRKLSKSVSICRFFKWEACNIFADFCNWHDLEIEMTEKVA